MRRWILRGAAALALLAASAGPAAAGDLGAVGVMTDVGVPDGMTASLVVRPRRPIRLHAGLGYNLVTRGARGGVTWVPLAWWLSPTASLDAGYFPEGDANPAARMITQDPTFSSPLLERVGYAFADAHVGIELGRRWATFYLHAGVSVVTGRVHGLGDPAAGLAFHDDPRATVWAPSARVGLIVYAL